MRALLSILGKAGIEEVLYCYSCCIFCVLLFFYFLILYYLNINLIKINHLYSSTNAFLIGNTIIIAQNIRE